MKHGAGSVCGAALTAAVVVVCLAWGMEASAQGWPDVGAPLEGGGGESPGDAALLVAVEDYAFVPDVGGANANLTAWFGWLRSGRGVPSEKIRVLRDAQATREDILDGLRFVQEKVGAGGTAWVVFIGHGAPSPDGKDGMWIGVDVQQRARSLESRSVRQGEVLGALKGGKQRQAVVVVDACFSGQDRSGKALVEGLQPLVPVEAPSATPGLVLLTAARSDQFAGPLPGSERPAFSYLLLGALRGWGDTNGDTKVTAKEAWSYTRDVLEATVIGRRQEPELSSATPDAVLAAPAREEAPDLDAARKGGERTSGVRGGGGDPAPRGGNMVRLETESSGDAFTIALVAFDGTKWRCDPPLTVSDPCTLDGVAAGPARLVIEGDAEATGQLEVTTGSTLVDVYPDTGWGYTVGGISLGVGIATLMGSFIGYANCDDGLSDCANATPYVIGMVAGGVGYFGGGILLGWAFWQDFKHDFRDFGVKAIPAARAASGEGSSAPEAGWGLSLGLGSIGIGGEWE